MKHYYRYCLVYFVILVAACSFIVWLGVRKPENQWDIDTQCFPGNYSATGTTCGSGKNIWRCYKGTMVISTEINSTMLYYDSIDPHSSAMTSEEAIEKIQENYPPGQPFECWYNQLQCTLRFQT